jgi:competence protein ComEC
MGSRVLYAIVGGFLAGVFVRSFVPLGLTFAGFPALLGLIAVLLGYFPAEGGSAPGGDVHKRKVLIVISVALFAFAGGIARMHISTLSGDPALTARLGQKVVLEGVVSDEPDARDTGVHISLAAAKIVATSSISVHAGVLIFAPPHAAIAYGDRVRVSGTLQLPEAFDTGPGRQFNYPVYLGKDGIGYELAFAQIQKTGSNEGNIFKAWAIRVKQLYLHGEDAALPEPEAGLAGGITVGDKRSIGSELSADFQRVSLIHMVVLSGYNITVVMNFVRWLLQLLPQFVQYGGVASAVLFFILMSGGAASAVRAGAMALVAVFARATGRVFLAGRILGVVALAMVMWNPLYLAFDPSFQLSALATLGLIFFTPVFERYMQWMPGKFGVREIAVSTLATQIAVVPLLLYQNGNLSIVALPANLLALAPVPLAMLLSFIAALGGIFLGPLAVVVAAPAYFVLAYIIGIARFFASLPFASVALPAFSAWWLAAAYVALFGGLWFIKNDRAGRNVPPVR